MPNHLYLSLCVGGVQPGNEQRAFLAAARPRLHVCHLPKNFSPIPKAKAISDDGFASSSQLPGYEQDTTTYLRYHVYLRTRRERVE